MKNKITTDLLPFASGVPHSRDNWPSPEGDKMCNAKDFLDNFKHDGFLDLFFNSDSQKFTVYKKTSEDLSDNDIDKIIQKLNFHLQNND